MYEERPSAVSPAVVWRSRPRGETRVSPDGCMDLIWLGDHLVVAGPDTTTHFEDSGASEVIGLRFHPGVGPHVVGVPAVELKDSRVPLDAIWSGPLVRRLTERIQEAPNRAASLEAIARRRLVEGGPIPAHLNALVAMIGQGANVSNAAARLGLSERQLHRRSLASFGYGPKVLGRILRFARASRLLQSGVSRADAAILSGYADQPHMTREFRALAGGRTSAIARP